MRQSCPHGPNICWRLWFQPLLLWDCTDPCTWPLWAAEMNGFGSSLTELREEILPAQRGEECACARLQRLLRWIVPGQRWDVQAAVDALHSRAERQETQGNIADIQVRALQCHPRDVSADLPLLNAAIDLKQGEKNSRQRAK